MSNSDIALELESLFESLIIFKGTILNNPNQTPEQKRESFEEILEQLREIMEGLYE